MNNGLGLLHNILEMQNILIEFALTHLVIAKNQEDKPIFCSYEVYKEYTEKETTYPVISEEEYNKLIEYLKERYDYIYEKNN